ncbi:MAG: hypothetical protein ABUL41_00285 [Chitinophagaceae bacterium]
MLLGKWAVCYSIEFSKNYSCEVPFTTYELSQDGFYIGGEAICMDKKYPITGTWKFENGNLTIKANNNDCIKIPLQVYYSIIFINKDLFYMKGVSKIENPDQPYYYYFKRLK